MAFGRTSSGRMGMLASCLSGLGLIVFVSLPAFGDASEVPDSITNGPLHSADDSEPPSPIGLRFGEPLENDRFRISVQFERIHKQGLRVSDDGISPSELFDNVPPSPVYLRSPRSLAITSHTFQLAYAPHPRVTLVAVVPFLQKELESLAASGLRSEVQTQGIGDLGFAVVLPFIRKGKESSHVHLGFDLPTGAIRRGGDETRLPYDNQIGNGTVDVEWGWTYRGHHDRFSWGGQILGRHPIGRNGLNYSEGSRFEASLWGGLVIVDGLSASLRLHWQKQNNIRLRDRVPNASILDPSDNAKARGGTRFTIVPGLTFTIPQLPHQRVAIEIGVPFFEDLDGPQLEQDWSIKTGWQWDF
jgi:hypothetical protein